MSNAYDCDYLPEVIIEIKEDPDSINTPKDPIMVYGNMKYYIKTDPLKILQNIVFDTLKTRAIHTPAFGNDISMR